MHWLSFSREEANNLGSRCPGRTPLGTCTVPALPLWHPPDSCQCRTRWRTQSLWLVPYRNVEETRERGSNVAAACFTPTPICLHTWDLTMWQTAHPGWISLPYFLSHQRAKALSWASPDAGQKSPSSQWPRTQSLALHCPVQIETLRLPSPPPLCRGECSLVRVTGLLVFFNDKVEAWQWTFVPLVPRMPLSAKGNTSQKAQGRRALDPPVCPNLSSTSWNTASRPPPKEASLVTLMPRTIKLPPSVGHLSYQAVVGGTALTLHMKKPRLREIKRFKSIWMVNRKVGTWFQIGRPFPFHWSTGEIPNVLTWWLGHWSQAQTGGGWADGHAP